MITQNLRNNLQVSSARSFCLQFPCMLHFGGMMNTLRAVVEINGSNKNILNYKLTLRSLHNMQ